MALSLKNLPWYGQIAVFTVLAVASGVVFYMYYDAPTRADMAVREKKLNQNRVEIAKAVTAARKLGQFKQEVAELEAQMVSLRATLPEEKDAADLLRQLQAVAAESSLTIKSFKPSPVVAREIHAEWPIALELDGSYHNLATFFDRVSKFSRIVNISNVDIKAKVKPDPGTGSTITAACVATTFVLSDKVEPTKDGKDSKGASKAPKAKPAAGKKAA